VGGAALDVHREGAVLEPVAGPGGRVERPDRAQRDRCLRTLIDDGLIAQAAVDSFVL